MLPAEAAPLQGTLSDALKREGQCDWTGAAALYHQVLAKPDVGQDELEIAEIVEKLSRSYFMAAFQANTREEFVSRMEIARASHEKAEEIYNRRGDQALSKIVEARKNFADFWLRDDANARRESAARSIQLASDAISLLRSHGERNLLAGAYQDLFTYYSEALNFSTDRASLLDQFEKGIETGWEAIEEFEQLADKTRLLESFRTAVHLFTWADWILEPSQYEMLAKKIGDKRAKMTELAKELGTLHGECLGAEISEFLTGDLDGNMAGALEIFEREMQRVRMAGDRLVVGRMLTAASSYTRWVAMSEEYVETRRKLLEKALEFSSEAIKNLEVCSQGLFLKLAYARYAEASTNIALVVETGPEKKKTWLRKAVEHASKALVYESHSWAAGAGHELSKALYFLATMEEDPREKERLLNEALPIREETVRVHDLIAPHSWARGVMLNYLALVRAELSRVQEEPSKRTKLLEDAIAAMGLCLEQCAKWAYTSTKPDPTLMEALANYEEWYGDILQQLHDVRLQPETAWRAIKVWEDAIAHFITSGHIGPIPPLRWKIARFHDQLGDYKESSLNFERAARDYRLVIGKVPKLAGTFDELASYMEAWGLIEESRFHHDEEQYTFSADNYTKVATILENTKSWHHLSRHYLACSLLENGEALSRQERQMDSLESFSLAVGGFREARLEVEARLQSSKALQERKELEDLLKINERRARYSQGRMQVEEANILDRKGQEEESARKYKSAMEVFRELLPGAASERGRRELETLILFCDAWNKMKEAELKASPELYAQAAKSFSEAELVAPRKRFRLLALANASICRALESGTRFRRTRDTSLYAEIKRKLETAADYYLEASFQNASDWTRATQRLFDALLYMADAESEMEAKRKTELYQLAEKHLEIAHRLYKDAGYSRKSDEALKHLSRVREEKNILLTPTDALSENPALTTAKILPISLLRDKAIGLERFQNANVVGKLGLSRKEVDVGSQIMLQLEFSNVGKTPATLVRLENVVPGGLELDSRRMDYPTADNTIEMKGKRLSHLESHEVKIPVRARRKGKYELQPRLLFVDDFGKKSSYEFEPATISVEELGIIKWIKG